MTADGPGATAGVREPDSFGIAVPEGWTRYDLEGDALAEARAGMLRRTPDRAERDLVNGTFRNARRILAAARRHGAVYAAGVTDLFEDGLLLAGVMIFRLTPPPGESFTAHELARQFSATGRRRRDRGDRRFSTVELPGIGPVGRLTGVEEADAANGVSYRVLVMHTVIPVPASRRVLIVTGYSPNLPLADQLYDVFDAITGTFSFEYGMFESGMGGAGEVD
ncbi:hypothetical protein [Streptomyces qinzhouensis]|uniref:Uncharacterized protein n=1 Tax=Streptomyces qinzhouensis TaxID=2599401 RepID=A0A5B8JP42_9ACTN|nr:hypothetical protein [Streptomyces qinzhouensis]QDY79433.1 hypothetical protein FQU76_26155 [Streptomyces qinzhouensis]